jgi:DNA polymerase IV (DinB-like DNA polymerase)
MNKDIIGDRIILAVDLDYFFAQCEEIRHPELVGKPLVICVYSGRTEESGAVSTANYVARGLGVRSGIPISSAKRILQSIPEAVFLPVDPDFYQSVSDEVMHILSTEYLFFERVSIDEAFLDVSSAAQRDFQNAKTIALELKSKIKESTSLSCSVGIAPNKLLAKMAADFEKPNGLTIVSPEIATTFLEGMKVGKLIGIGPKIEKRMESLGIKTIGDLASFDELKLSQEFGSNLGPRLRQLAQGIDNSPVQSRETTQYSRIITLKADADTFSFLAELEPLALDLSNRLNEANRKAKTIGIIFITHSLKIRSKSRTLERTIQSAEDILEQASSLFEELFRSSAATDLRLRRVGIRVSGFSGKDLKFATPSGQLTDYFSS